MTVDELSEILDRFHESLQEVSVWVLMRDPQMGDHPPGLAALDQAWRDLSDKCALMKDAEPEPPPQPSASLRQRCPELLDDGPVSLPSWSAGKISENSEASTVRMPSPADENADQIGSILDQFREALLAAEQWASRANSGHDMPVWANQLDSVYRDLCRVYGTMKSEQPSATDENAARIGNLCGRMSRLEGEVKALREAISPIVQMSPLPDASVPGRSHEDSGLRSVTFISDAEGFSKPCKKCKHCGEWIRPGYMGQECEKATK